MADSLLARPLFHVGQIRLLAPSDLFHGPPGQQGVGRPAESVRPVEFEGVMVAAADLLRE
jgi:hypothetical protein